MPPKKSAQAAAKSKAVADKTFGLKNKKGAKVSKYVQQVERQVSEAGNQKARKAEQAAKDAKEAKRKAEEARKAELKELFKPAAQIQKVPFGVDPKTILCNFFKNGTCQKGSRCKFSHDVNVERKTLKADLYTDARDDESDEAKKNEDSSNWTQEQLEAAITSKHGTDNANKNRPTDIVCKYFLEAVETGKYGWFWECPNGGKKCIYRHALPPGYVLKKRESEAERREREANERENALTLEDFLETERHNIQGDLTPITAETFAAWKQRRLERKAEAETKAIADKAEAYKKQRAGMKTGMAFSGKELFDFNPDWAVGADDDDDGAMDVYQREASSDEEGSD
ncbi:hypothetical protein CXG81DRAFT_6502, partial [Caulochytrium protostelioides]